MIELKSAEEIGRMGVAGQFVGELLAELRGVAAVGVNLMDIERHARRRIKERGAESCYWDYAPSFGRGPFRNVLCLSVNDAVLHGLPHEYVLRDGDLLSIDMAVGIEGWVADSALSVVVGTPDPADLKLIEATEVALEAGIKAAQPGGRLGDISAAIGEVAHSYGYGVNGEFGGHGIGRTMHEAPHVANSGRPRRGMKLDPGLTIAIEPWLCAATDKIRYDEDGWTIRSADGSRTAHSEHTIAITESGPQVLTRRPATGTGPADPARRSATAP
ncbi:type I methionyl aminopeptidase [Actinoplanes sp. NPDC051343]|uniref:type I methionyl aminopeptidase n=1 Tax=Actinoplanes sp. NPDC051343 TaxID=3363906 RepID=UPI0037B39A57